MSAPATYEAGLRELAAERPRLSRRLADAEVMRKARLALYAEGVRFAGLEEMLLALDRVEGAWQADTKLGPVAFLVGRAIADFETAVEAGLSGYVAVAHDAMRDVMEIELLLLDFFANPSSVETWLDADRAHRLRHYRPAVLRERLGDLLEVNAPDVEADYRGHSETLHVGPPPRIPSFRRGHVADNDVLSSDSPFVEIFEHGRRLGNALLLAAHSVSPDSKAERACYGPLPAFQRAHERTQVLLTQYLSLLNSVLRARSGGDVGVEGEGSG